MYLRFLYSLASMLFSTIICYTYSDASCVLNIQHFITNHVCLDTFVMAVIVIFCPLNF